MILEGETFVWAAAGLLLLQVVAHLRVWKRNAKYLIAAVRAIPSRLHALWLPGRGAADDSESAVIKEEVAKRTQRRRRELFDVYLGCMSWSLCGAYSYQLLSNASGMRWLPIGCDVTVALFSILVAFLILFPRALTADRVPYYASAMYVLHIVAVSELACPSCVASLVDQLAFLPRILLSLCALKWPVASSWAALHFAVLSYNIASCVVADCEVPMLIRQRVFVALGREMLACLVVFLFQVYTEGDMRRDIKSSISQSALRATSSLLDLMCDVVVELDSELKVAKNADRLAVVLFQRSASSVAGRHMSHFMHSDEDQKLFVDAMGQVGNETERSAQVFHLPVKDGQGKKISMEFFHVCFLHLGEVRHLLGLRELSDPIGQVARKNSGSASSADEATAAPRTTNLSAPSQQPFVPRQVSVTFDARTFEISGCSQGFVAWFGEPPSKLIEWFRRPSSLEDEFRAGYRRALVTFISDFEVQGTQEDIGTICLQLPKPGRGRRPHYQAACAVTFRSLTEDKYTDFPGKVVATLEMRGVRARQRGGPSTASQTNSSFSFSSGSSNLGGTARRVLPGGSLAKSTKVSV